MKKIPLIICIVCIVLAGYLVIKQTRHDIQKNNDINNVTNKTNSDLLDELIEQNTKQNEVKDEKTTTNTSKKNTIKNDEKITKEDALKLVQDRYSIEDQETQNQMSYSYITTVQDKNGVQYYAFRQSFLEDGNQMSFLQNVFVSFDGTRIETNSQSVELKEGEVVKFEESIVEINGV